MGNCRLKAAGIRCPTPYLLRLHVLVMEFIGIEFYFYAFVFQVLRWHNWMVFYSDLESNPKDPRCRGYFFLPFSKMQIVIVQSGP